MRARARHVDVFCLGLVSALALGCTGDGAPEGELRGEIEVRIVDHWDGSSSHTYHLLPADGSRPLRLAFGADPELAPGTAVSVWGRAGAAELVVDRWKARELPLGDDPSLEVKQHAVIGGMPFPKRKLAFVLVDLGGGVNISVEEARRKAFGLAPGDQSMKQVVLEYSFGRQDLEGEVIGPLATTMTGCDEDGVAERLRPMVPAGFDNIVWYLGQRVAACGWAGVAPLGRLGRIANQLWVNGTASCRVATHEFGHNLGLQHAARLRCMGAPMGMADDLTKCTSSEYGDNADVMGDGCNHFNGYSKAYLNWFERCNGVAVGSPGTFTLLPMATACDGTQVLFVPMAKLRRMGNTDLRNYALELRAPIGLDARFSTPQVMVRLVAPVAQMRSARMTWIVDVNPATPAIDGLKTGETFADPAGGVSFKVEAIDARVATVKVEMAGAEPNTCLGGMPFSPPGSLMCATGAAPAPPPPPPRPDAGAPAPRPDAGAAPMGTGGAPVAGTGGAPVMTGPGGAPGGATPEKDAGAPPPPPMPAPSGSVPAAGCGCRVDGGGAGSPAGLLLLIGAMIWRFRRRRALDPIARGT